MEQGRLVCDLTEVGRQRRFGETVNLKLRSPDVRRHFHQLQVLGQRVQISQIIGPLGGVKRGNFLR